MNRNLRSFFLILVVLLIFSGLFSACRELDDAEKIWVKSPDWSRAISLGITNIGDQVPIVISPEGDVYTFLIQMDEEFPNEYYPALVSVGKDGRLAWRKTLDIVIKQPDLPKMLLAEDGIYLFWIGAHNLYTAKVDFNGDLIDEPISLSAGEVIGTYAVARNENGKIDIWYSGKRGDPGLFAFTLGTDPSEKQLIDPEGVQISLTYDKNNVLHAVWANYPAGYGDAVFYYANYQDGDVVLDRQAEIFRQGVSPALLIKGPVLALDFKNVYVFWNVYVNAGLEAGNLETRYVVLTSGTEERITEPMKTHVPIGYKLKYEILPNSSLNTGERVVLAKYMGPATSQLEDISANTSQIAETAIVFSSKTQYLWSKSKRQVNIVYLKDGEPTSYQPISFTVSLSTAPTIASDTEGNLYLTWLENKYVGNNVYFATTAPAMQGALNEITLTDVTTIIGETLFGIVAGVTLMPLIGIVWGGIALSVLVVNVLFKRFNNKSIKIIGETLSIGLALAIYWTNKLTTLSVIQGGLSITEGYVPFSAWIPGIPESFYLPLQFGFPILIGLVALYAAWYYTYKRHSPSPLYFVLIYVAVDSFFSMAIYGMVIWSAF
ncbi:MAG: hypothetical protein DRI56_00295 [Chloroflexota bacterium]|nr:MAG: hypothetical protein DRI56_00295 [Chloroflexota bacterium]